MALSEVYAPEQPVKNEIEYFYLEPKQLVILSIVTLGFYDLYWFYRNWHGVKKAENTNISPAGRSLFAVFYCYQFFKKVLVSAKKYGYLEDYSPKLLAFVYIFILVFGSLASNLPEYIQTNGWYFLATLGLLVFTNLTVIPLYIVQKAINYNNSKVNPNYQDTQRFKGGELFFIIVGLILFSVTIWGLSSFWFLI